MAVGGSEYSVLLKAVIQKLTQAEIDAQTKGLKINLDVNLVGVGAVAEQIDKIKKSTSGGGIYAGEGFTDAADKMAIMSAEVEKIRSNFAGLGENVTVTKIFDDEKIRKYSVSVDKIANGLKTVDRYTVDIGEDGQQIITNAKSTEKAFDSIATKQKKLTDLSEKYKLQLESLKTVHADAFGKGDTSIEESERKYLNLIDSFKKGNATTQEVSNAFIDLKNKVKDVENGFDSSRAHTDAFTTAITKNIMKVFQWAIATTAIYGSLRKIGEGVEYVTALNSEMTNIQIVTGNTTDEINKLSSEYNKLAKELGVTTLEVARGNLEWARQGKSAEDSAELLRASVMLAKLANLDQAESTEYLTSIINGYKLSIEEVMPTIDKLISLDNAYASSVGEIAAALQKTASTAKLAGVSLDQMAAMITVVSDVTRVAPETIGNAFKTILTRMQNVKIGAFFDEEGQSISDVEKVLTGLGITLRDETTKQFRNMGTVLEETMQLWNKLGKEGKTVEQSMLANAFAGVRQAEIFRTLMENQDKYNEALKIEAESLGLTENRYGYYSKSIEAANNRLKASWESVWEATMNDDVIVGLANATSKALELTSAMGGLVPIIKAIAAIFIGIKLPSILATLSKIKTSIVGVGATLKGLFATLSTTNLYVAGILALAGAFVYLSAVVNNAKNSINALYENFEKSLNVLKDNQNELQSLADEYKFISSKETLSYEDKTRLLDIQTILNTKYSDSIAPMNLYSDAIDKNSEAIARNIEQMKAAIATEAEDFITANAERYEKAKELLSKPESVEVKTQTFLGGLPLPVNLTTIESEQLDAEERLAWLAEKINEYERDGTLEASKRAVILREEYDALQEQVNKAQEIIIAYEGQLNILNAIEEETSNITSELESLEISVKTPEQLQVLTDEANEATSAIADTASKVMALAESLEESGIASMEQVEQLKSLFPDTYTQALIIENDQIKINTQAMKDLMVARAEELVSKAQEAVDSIKVDNAVAESALQRANFIISATRAEIKANASMSESDRERAQNTINAAKSEIAAINEAAKARGVSLTNAENNLALAQAYLAQIKNTSYNYADLSKAADKAASSTNSLSEAQKAYNDLLEITIKMLKQEKQDQIDALEKELDNYKKIIDAKKESLDLDKEAIDYQKNLADKNKVLSDIDNELLQIQFDNSEEGKKRRLELEAERAEAVEEINELQADRSYEIQKDALDREYETYKESMENRIAALQDYLEQEGTIRNEAIALLQARTDEFYRSLIEWNRIYGSGIDSDIIDKWAIADKAVQTFASNAGSALSGVGSAIKAVTAEMQKFIDKWHEEQTAYAASILTIPEPFSETTNAGRMSMNRAYHEGGVVGVETHHDGNVAGGLPKIKESEVFAKLLKGEVVATESQMKNFINNTLPALSTNISGGTNIGNIQLSFNIAGDLDRSVVPDIKNIITETLMDITKSRGILRNANSFSL